MTDSGSTRPSMPGVTEIFAEYVRLRQKGRKQQDVVNHLRPVMERLRRDARKDLVALLRSWEAREGSKYQQPPPPPPPVPAAPVTKSPAELAALPIPGEDLSWLPEPATRPIDDMVLGSPVPGMGQEDTFSGGALSVDAPVHPAVRDSGPPSSRVIEGPPIPSTQQDVLYCPTCSKSNRFGDAYCFSCGTLLNVTGVQTRSLDPATGDLAQIGQMHFGQSSSLLMHVRGHNQPLYVPIRDRGEIVLGRISHQTATRPDVDLTPYNAGDFGVSRAHARLRYQDNTVTLTDLGSVNHTFINGQRLHANEVRVLRDGDEIRLGRLAMKVVFQHTVRQLK